MYICRKNGKIPQTKISKLFSYDYDHYDVATEMLLICESSRDGYWAFSRKKLWILITMANI